MYKQVILQLILLNKLLWTDVTREPIANVVGLQQMPLALVLSLKTARAVPARELLRARVHSNMKPQGAFGLKSCSTVATVIRPYVVMYAEFMFPHTAGIAESSVAHRTLVRFVSLVDSHVPGQSARPPKRLVANGTFVRLRAAVNSAVHSQTSGMRKSLVTNTTFERFLSRMSSHVRGQLPTARTTLAAFRATVLIGVKIHMSTQHVERVETFPTLRASACNGSFSAVQLLLVTLQQLFAFKPFIANGTRKRSFVAVYEAFV